MKTKQLVFRRTFFFLLKKKYTLLQKIDYELWFESLKKMLSLNTEEK